LLSLKRMNIKSHIMKKYLVLFAFIFLGIAASAQVKIGYANLEYILKNLPEAQKMNLEIENYQKKLQEQVAVKQEYYQSLLEDFYGKQQAGYAESLLESMRNQIVALEQEIQIDITNADAQLSAMSVQKLQPITDKIVEAINVVYEEQGYTYIFNSADGTGNSIVLKGPEADNLTFTILEKLGVKTEISQ
jgi:outer membrane protein